VGPNFSRGFQFELATTTEMWKYASLFLNFNTARENSMNVVDLNFGSITEDLEEQNSSKA
jgi:hypothetical protein